MCEVFARFAPLSIVHRRYSGFQSGFHGTDRAAGVLGQCTWNDRNGKRITSLRVLQLKEDAMDWNRVEGNWKHP